LTTYTKHSAQLYLLVYAVYNVDKEIDRLLSGYYLSQSLLAVMGCILFFSISI